MGKKTERKGLWESYLFDLGTRAPGPGCHCGEGREDCGGGEWVFSNTSIVYQGCFIS